MACQFCTMPADRHEDGCPYDTDAHLYAAVLYAITGTRPDMPAAERERLADAIVSVLRERAIERERGQKHR